MERSVEQQVSSSTKKVLAQRLRMPASAFAGSASNALLGAVIVNGGRLDLAKTGGSSAIVGALLIGDGTRGIASDA